MLLSGNINIKEAVDFSDRQFLALDLSLIFADADGKRTSLNLQKSDRQTIFSPAPLRYSTIDDPSLGIGPDVGDINIGSMWVRNDGVFYMTPHVRIRLGNHAASGLAIPVGDLSSGDPTVFRVGH